MNNLFKPVRPKLSAVKAKKAKEAEKVVEPEKKDLYSDSREKGKEG